MIRQSGNCKGREQTTYQFQREYKVPALVEREKNNGDVKMRVGIGFIISRTPGLKTGRQTRMELRCLDSSLISYLYPPALHMENDAVWNPARARNTGSWRDEPVVPAIKKATAANESDYE